MFDGLDTAAQAHFVTPDQLMVWAERVRPHLAKMTDSSGGRYIGADLLTAIAAGRMQLWLGLRGSDLVCVMLTEIQSYPRLRAMRMVGLVGSRPRVWRHLLAAVETSAKRDFGCAMMECVHIPRFAALLPGYRTTHWFGEKVLG